MLHTESVSFLQNLSCIFFPHKNRQYILLASAMQSNPAPTMAEFEVFFLDLCFRFIEHNI